MSVHFEMNMLVRSTQLNPYRYTFPSFLGFLLLRYARHVSRVHQQLN
jgi:hypothetical protein